MVGDKGNFDIIIVGAGPSGCAAAIWAAKNNLKVLLIEGSAFPRYKPGETLHPGIAVLLSNLEVFDDVKAAAKIRHRGFWVRNGRSLMYSPYGEDHRGKWEGFQIMRKDLDCVLLNRVRLLNVEILQPFKALRAICTSKRIIGIETTNGSYYSKYIIDASEIGRAHV